VPGLVFVLERLESDVLPWGVCDQDAFTGRNRLAAETAQIVPGIGLTGHPVELFVEKLPFGLLFELVNLRKWDLAADQKNVCPDPRLRMPILLARYRHLNNLLTIPR
jgi:hypothetical protein